MTRTHLFSLALLSAALPAGATPARFITTTETVTDSSTGLIWQRSISARSYTWAAAKSYCDALSLAGSADWRLPTIKELQSIVDEGRGMPSINKTTFPSTPSDIFWSSSLHAFLSATAWGVDFSYGGPSGFDVTDATLVRCVR